MSRPFPIRTVRVNLHLTPRQLEVVQLLCRGYDSSEIATELGITERTTKAHCDIIRMKLGVKSRHKIPNAYRAATENDLEGPQ